MSSLLHLSDTHFGTEFPEVVEALLRLHEHLTPELVVLSGDVTQRARRSQFAAAKRFLERLGARAVLVVPGNHDLPLFHLGLRLADPYRRYREAFGADLEPLFAVEELMVVGVNTTRARRFKHGELSAIQIARVRRMLAEARPEQVRVVVVHQPLHVPTTKDEVHLLRGGAEAARSWASAGADLVLGGHIHLPFVIPLNDRYPDIERRVWVAHAGTAVSRRLRGDLPNSVNVVRVAQGAQVPECVVERWDYDRAAGAFTPAQRRSLLLSRVREAPKSSE